MQNFATTDKSDNTFFFRSRNFAVVELSLSCLSVSFCPLVLWFSFWDTVVLCTNKRNENVLFPEGRSREWKTMMLAMQNRFEASTLWCNWFHYWLFCPSTSCICLCLPHTLPYSLPSSFAFPGNQWSLSLHKPAGRPLGQSLCHPLTSFCFKPQNLPKKIAKRKAAMRSVFD